MASVSVQKTANGKAWRVMWRDKTGKQRQVTRDKKREADAYAAQLRVDLSTGSYIDPRLARTTVGQQYVYWQTHRTVSRGRTALEASVAAHHLLPTWCDVALEDVTFDAVQAWINDRAAVLSPAYTKSCFRLMHGTMASGVRSRKIPSNPLDGIVLPKQQRKALTWDDVLTAFELGAVTDHAEDRWRAFIFCSGWLGWRLSEGLGIRRRDVNLLRNEITVGRVVIEEVNGRCEERASAKTDTSVRVLPLPPTVAKAIEQHLLERVHDPSPDALLFTQENGKSPSRSNLLRRVLYPAMARGGVVPPAAVRKARDDAWQVRWYTGEGRCVTRLHRTEEEARAFADRHGGTRGVDFRQLRHTAASLMIDAGLDVVDVSQRLGHARPSITMDIYTHLFTSKRDRNTAAIETAIQQAGGRA